MTAKKLFLAWSRAISVRRNKIHRPLYAAATFTCFHVRRSGGGWLFASGTASQKAKVIHSQVEVSAPHRIILCVPDGNIRVGFLIAADGKAITTLGDLAMGSAVAVIVERGKLDAPIKFLHPINPAWQLGVSTDQGRSDGAIVFAHRPPNLDCDFTLERLENDILAPAVHAAAKEIAANFALLLRHETILSSVRSGLLRPNLAAAVLSCLPRDELEALAIKLIHDEPLRVLLRSCLPGDPWMAKRFARLLEWNERRDDHWFCSGEVTFAEADDIPGSGKPLAHRPKLGLALNALARRNIHPRRMACVVGSARNEGPYLLDWIAHHLAVGFEHVFLYTNDTTDGSDALLDVLSRAGVITWLDNKIGPDSLPQFRAYAHALSILPQTLDYRWTLVADLDEYFSYDVDKFHSVSDYLAWQEIRRAEAIALPWLIYTAGKNDVWRDASCTERFVKREQNVNHHVKSMFRSNRHWSSSCHNPLPMLEFPINYLAQNRMPHIAKSPENNIALAHNPQATHAWIAHYIFKSAPEAMMKVLRGKGDAVRSERFAEMERVMKSFVTLCNKNDLIEDRRTLGCAQGAREQLSRLRDIPGVQNCERDIKHQFSARMSAACTQFLREGHMEGETKECAAFRSILQRQSHNALFSVETV